MWRQSSTPQRAGSHAFQSPGMVEGYRGAIHGVAASHVGAPAMVFPDMSPPAGVSPSVALRRRLTGKRSPTHCAIAEIVGSVPGSLGKQRRLELGEDPEAVAAADSVSNNGDVELTNGVI